MGVSVRVLLQTGLWTHEVLGQFNCVFNWHCTCMTHIRSMNELSRKK